jgi:hypothetical protein
MLWYKERQYAHVLQRDAAETPYAIAFGALLALWASARFLKKTKRLREA